VNSPPRITVFGLGEAGSGIAADLARAGADVHGFDPADVDTPVGVVRHPDPILAVGGAGMVMAVTAASDAEVAMAQAWEAVAVGTVYADLSTSSPRLKQNLATNAAQKGVAFADVALMAPVPGRGLSTPALASGTGARDFALAVNPMGGRVEAIGVEAGQAAGRKLLRSIVTKGLTALVIESLEAGKAADDLPWLWEHLVGQLTDLDEAFLRRMLSGTEVHVDRRLVEMESAREHLQDLGVGSEMTEAVVARLRRVREEGLGGLADLSSD
jgi:3-hydroxyisobutyrate dehydrogenase-like beta-hydroxyacid dehydrogenase